MKPLLLPYIFNILVLIPVGLATLFGGAAGGRFVFQGRFPLDFGHWMVDRAALNLRVLNPATPRLDARPRPSAPGARPTPAGRPPQAKELHPVRVRS